MRERKILRAEEPLRLDQLLARAWPSLSRHAVQRMIQAGEVWINTIPARKPGQQLSTGDEVAVVVPTLEEAEEAPSFLHSPVEVLYEDESLLVIDKPAEVAMHPERRGEQGTVVQRLARYLPEIAHIGGVERAGTIIRLEEGVSGLILAAKDEVSYRALRRALKHRQIRMTYSVLVEGRLTGEGVIDQPIGNAKRGSRQMAVSREGRPARTRYWGQRHYREQGRSYSLLMVRPESARLHQIRVHLAWYGYPVVGDRRYGSRHQPILDDRLFIHLGVLEFPHPATGEWVRVESALPAELRSILRYMTRPRR